MEFNKFNFFLDYIFFILTLFSPRVYKPSIPSFVIYFYYYLFFFTFFNCFFSFLRYSFFNFLLPVFSFVYSIIAWLSSFWFFLGKLKYFISLIIDGESWKRSLFFLLVESSKEFARPLSLRVRLYLNLFIGDLLLSLYYIVFTYASIYWLLIIFFGFLMEFFVFRIQSYIFSRLVFFYYISH